MSPNRLTAGVGYKNLLIAVIVPSVLFGALHVLGTGFSLGSILLVVLAGTAVGIMFSIIAIESESIWCGGLVHAIWNILMIGGGLSISSSVDEHALATYVLQPKSVAITGGEFGVESSVISLLGYIVVALIAYVRIRKKRA